MKRNDRTKINPRQSVKRADETQMLQCGIFTGWKEKTN